MKNKVLLAFIIIAIVFSILSIVPRHNIEKANRSVELIMDNNYLNKLVKKNNLNKDDVYKLLKDNGLTGIAVYRDSVRTLINEKKARLITGNEIRRLDLLTSAINPIYKDFALTDDCVFFVIDDRNNKKRILSLLPIWHKEYGVEYKEKDDKLVIYFDNWKTKYLDLIIGFSMQNIKQIKNASLKIIPRLSNDIESYKQWEFINEIDTEMIIFSGSEVVGYKDDITETAQVMNKNDLKYGMIEKFIAAQAGSDRLAKLLNYNLVRVHSIQQPEMDKYNMEKLINRYLRAVRERDVRVLYLKPFLKGEDSELLKNNLEFVNQLTARLKAEGYNSIGAKPYPFFKNPLLYLLITGVGIFAAGIILLENLLARELKFYLYILVVIFIIVEILLIIKGKTILLRQLLALGSSVIFPTLAITYAVKTAQSKKYLLSFLQVIGISLLGVLFLVASLSQLSFVLKVNQFRGVKLAFIIPLILVSYYYYKQYLNSSEEDSIGKLITEFLETEIKIKHILLILLIGIGGMIYIGRTGNYPILPVPAWEISMRNILEKYLYIRPRFKAFLFGHPFLLIVLVYLNDKRKLLMYPVVLLATVGQITILNTFSHIHTPLIVSLIRFVNGIWLGLVVGIILLIIIKFTGFIKEKLYD